MLEIIQDKCTGCGECVAWCPTDALSVWITARLDEEKCNQCLDCIPNCPVDALKEVVS